MFFFRMRAVAMIVATRPCATHAPRPRMRAQASDLQLAAADAVSGAWRRRQHIQLGAGVAAQKKDVPSLTCAKSVDAAAALLASISRSVCIFAWWMLGDSPLHDTRAHARSTDRSGEEGRIREAEIAKSRNRSKFFLFQSPEALT